MVHERGSRRIKDPLGHQDPWIYLPNPSHNPPSQPREAPVHAHPGEAPSASPGLKTQFGHPGNPQVHQVRAKPGHRMGGHPAGAT